MYCPMRTRFSTHRTVTADGTYVTQSAFSVAKTKTEAVADSNVSLRTLMLEVCLTVSVCVCYKCGEVPACVCVWLRAHVCCRCGGVPGHSCAGIGYRT